MSGKLESQMNVLPESVCFSFPKSGPITFFPAGLNVSTNPIKNKSPKKREAPLIKKDFENSFLIKNKWTPAKKILTPAPIILDLAWFNKNTKQYKNSRSPAISIFFLSPWIRVLRNPNTAKAEKNCNNPPKVKWVFIRPMEM